MVQKIHAYKLSKASINCSMWVACWQLLNRLHPDAFHRIFGNIQNTGRLLLTFNIYIKFSFPKMENCCNVTIPPLFILLYVSRKLWNLCITVFVNYQVPFSRKFSFPFVNLWLYSGLKLSHCESRIAISFPKFAAKTVTLLG